MPKKTKPKSPNKLAKTGEPGVALSETELGQAQGGAIASGKFIKIDFGG